MGERKSNGELIFGITNENYSQGNVLNSKEPALIVCISGRGSIFNRFDRSSNAGCIISVETHFT